MYDEGREAPRICVSVPELKRIGVFDDFESTVISVDKQPGQRILPLFRPNYFVLIYIKAKNASRRECDSIRHVFRNNADGGISIRSKRVRSTDDPIAKFYNPRQRITLTAALLPHRGVFPVQALSFECAISP